MGCSAGSPQGQIYPQAISVTPSKTFPERGPRPRQRTYHHMYASPGSAQDTTEVNVVWIRTQCKQSTVLRGDLDGVRRLLLDIPRCGRLMPSVRSLDSRGGDVYYYQLDTFSYGAISREPHGEHNFRSWGAFRTTAGPVDGEVVVEIDTHAEADVAIDRVLIP